MRIETEGSGYAERRQEPNRPPDGRLSGLVDRLHVAQQRSFYGALLAGGIVSIVIGLAAFCILQLVYALSGGLGSVAADPVQAAIAQNVVIAATLAVGCAALTWFYAVRGRVWLTSMARAADSRFRLEETMSTALELVATPAYAGSGVVGDALIKRAEARTGSVNAQTLTPMRVPKAAIAFPILIGVALWLVLAPPPPVLENIFEGGLFGGEATTDVTEPERTNAAADLHAIAAIIRQDGEQRADPGLQAIAQQIERLATDIENNPGATRDQIGDEMQRLMDLAGQAYARAGEQAGGARDMSRLIQSTLGQFDPNRMAAEAATEYGTAPPPGNATPGAEAMDAPFEAVAVRNEDGGFERDVAGLPMPGLGVNPNQINQTNNGAPGNWAEPTAPMETPLDDDYGPYGPEGPGGEAPGAAGGEIAGAADGAGDIAGLGAAALFGPDGRPLDAIAIAGQMLLEDRARDGRRIQVNLPPLTQLLGVDTGALDAGAWTNLIERQVNRTALPAADREVIMRYFEAMMREPAE